MPSPSDYLYDEKYICADCGNPRDLCNCPAPSTDIKQSIVYWVGYIEEANRHIELLTGKNTPSEKLTLQIAKRKRGEALQKIAELGGSADFIKQLLGS